MDYNILWANWLSNWRSIKIIIKQILADRITTQAQPLNVIITAIYEYHTPQIFVTVDKRSNMQLYALKQKPHG